MPLPAPVTTATLPLRSNSLPLVSSDNQIGDEARPTGLVRGAQPCASVPVEVLVERDQVVPRVVFLEPRLRAKHGTATAIVEEYAQQSRGDFIGDLGKVAHLARPG